MKRFPAGRLGDNPATGLSASLNAAGFKLGRLQTGTPARLDRNTIDFSHLLAQEGDASPSPFSFLHDIVDNAVLSCSLWKFVISRDAFQSGKSSFLLSNAHYTRNTPDR
jgi:tRNA uridine 5-carboxymethylaminomethyl modification enzyme